MDTPNLEQRVDELADRLDRIERQLEMVAAKPIAKDQPKPPLTHTNASTTPIAPTRKVQALERVPLAAEARSGSKGQLRTRSIEQFIGGRGFAAVGALVIVIGVALFARFAWQQGWFGLLSPAAKVGMSAAFGAMLLVAGEFIRRKWGALASAGPSAAGLGAIYASAYAAYAVYELTSIPSTFIMLAATAALGIAVAVRANLASIAIVSLLGGYLAPVLLTTDSPSHLIFTSYISILLVSALVLSGWRGPKQPMFFALRSVGWLCTAFLGAVWSVRYAADAPIIALGFVGLVWAVVHAERLIATRRVFPVDDEKKNDELESGSNAAIAPNVWRAAAASFSTTAWTTALAILAIESGLTIESWLAPAALSAGALALSFVFAGHLRIMHDVPRIESERIGVSLMVQAGSLLILTLAMALTGWAEVIAGLALGLGAIVCGRWLNTKALDIYGLVSLVIASAYAAILSVTGSSWGSGQLILGLYVTTWELRFALIALTWFAAGALMLIRNPDRQPSRAITAAAVGIVILTLTALHPESQTPSIILAWLGLAIVLAGLNSLLGRLQLKLLSLVLCAAAAVLWIPRVALDDWSTSAASIGLHPGLLLAIAIATSAIAIERLTRWPRDNIEFGMISRLGIPAAGAVLLFVATSLEVARGAELFANDPTVQRSALSIYWGIVSVGMIGFGFIRRLAPVRYVGLALMGIAAGKALLLDMIGVPAPWRIASFLVLGLLMVGVAVGYARAAALIGPKSPG